MIDRALREPRRRLSLLASMALALAVIGASQAAAQEWTQRFDNGGLDETNIATDRPVLSPEIAAAMGLAIIDYQNIVAMGGWPVVPADAILRLGVTSPSVMILRQRLIASHDLDASLGGSQVFDSYVDAAVRRFQARHGIPADGIVGPTSFAALNVPADVRLTQLVTNRQRLQELAVTTRARYVMVNLPAAEIEVVENGQVVSRHTAVVGRVDRASPILSSEIYEVNFNPFWTVPASIIQRDLIPLMQTNPTYLTDQHIRMYNAQGQEVLPQNVNWYSNEATRYTFRQDPGDFNSLGSVRINFHNQYSVYLHDTPNKTLFGNDYRFDSSGCVRVQNVRELINFLLRDTAGWDRARIEGAFASGERTDVRLAQPVQIFFAYITAWSMEDGVVHFRDDIYAYDGVGTIAQR
ncbi:MAG: L,D-transpeptidase family protein [Bauldia sp.]|nr:L,D-transpeptidase family protein [Bauldia sp.]MCW5716798.1 L,D-transpeptidase family protein [Bauldia sp.]